MDQAWVLVCEGGEWECLAAWFCPRCQALTVLPSPDRDILQQLLQENPTAVVKGVVAAIPVILPDGRFAGALYCSAPIDLSASPRAQTLLALVELLVRAVALELAFVGGRKGFLLVWDEDRPEGAQGQSDDIPQM
jgi:hypothetical protein